MSIEDDGVEVYKRNDDGLVVHGFAHYGMPTTVNKYATNCILISGIGVYSNEGTPASPSFQDMNSVKSAEIASGAVTLAKLATIVSPSHIIKFFKLGSTITTTALVGVAVGDLVVTILANGTVTVETVAVADTLPSDPADTSYVLVIRATS